MFSMFFVLGREVLVTDRMYEQGDLRRSAYWVCLYAVAGLLGCMLVSAPMWWPRIEYPLVPTWGVLESIAPFLSVFLMGCFLVFVLFGTLWQEQAWSLGLAGVCVVGLILVDLLRLQPWLIHLAGVLMLWGILKPHDTEEQAEGFLWVAGWLLVLIYFWSGWHKFQPLFGKHSLFLALSWLPASWQQILLERWSIPLGYSVACVEMLLALSLLLPETRRLGVVLLSAMHLLLCTSLVVLQHDVVVIPWNLACIGLLWLLFWKEDSALLLETLPIQERRFSLAWIILAFFAVLPALHTVDRWDPNLSFALYSGNYTRPTLHIAASSQKRLSPSMKKYIHSTNHKRWIQVDLYRWSTERFQTTAPPSLFFYRAALSSLCQRNPGIQARLVWRDRFLWFRTRRKERTATCRVKK